MNHLHFFKVGQVMSKYGHLILPREVPDKVTPDIGFIDEALVQYYDVPVLKILYE